MTTDVGIVLREFNAARRVLIAVASPGEVRAVLEGLGAAGRIRTGEGVPEPWRGTRLSDAIELVQTGVGKANAAGAVARALDPTQHGLVLGLGIAGALPRPQGGPLANHTRVAATACVHADEGVETPGGFMDIATLGFAPGTYGLAVPTDVARLASVCDVTGAVATVSSCSGTDERAAAVAARSGAIAETMESAAWAHAAWRLGVACAELRVISNRTGDRARQGWDIPGALQTLRDAVARM